MFPRAAWVLPTVTTQPLPQKAGVDVQNRALQVFWE